MASLNFGDDLAKTVKKQLECPVCIRHFENKPIYMCPNGHNVCSLCQPALYSCPVCRHPERPSNRNTFAEELAESAITPCENSTWGCKEPIKTKDMKSHVTICKYRFKCQFEECKWQGYVFDLGPHALAVHQGYCIPVKDNGVMLKINTIVSKSQVEKQETATPAYPVQVLGVLFGNKKSQYSTATLVFKKILFWIHTELSNKNSFGIKISLVNPYNEASLQDFSYELTFISEYGSRLVYKNNVSKGYFTNNFFDTVLDGGISQFYNESTKCVPYKLKLFNKASIKEEFSVNKITVNSFQLRNSKPESSFSL